MTSLLLFGPYLAVVLLVGIGALLTPVFLTGVPLLVVGRFLSRLAGRVERARYRVLLGHVVTAPAAERLPTWPQGAPTPA